MSKGIYKLYVNCGRMGSLQGLYVYNKEDVEKCIGQTTAVYEVLGKHSEIEVYLEEEDIKLISEDPIVISFLEENLDGGVGFDIIGQMLDEEDEWEDEDEG